MKKTNQNVKQLIKNELKTTGIAIMLGVLLTACKGTEKKNPDSEPETSNQEVVSEKPKSTMTDQMVAMLENATDDTHCDEPSGTAVMNPEIRYPGTTPPPCSINVHGEIEELDGGIKATHWFVEAEGVTWHFVTAGDPRNKPILFIHGLPESWHGFHHQMAALSDNYYTIAIDQMGYGQSDKRLKLEYSNAAMAKKLTALLDKISVEQFHLVTHDRGSVTADYLIAVPGMSDRVLHYIRMQQSGSEPHGEPRPPHDVFSTEKGIKMFKSKEMIKFTYAPGGYVIEALPEEETDRILYEFTYKGVAEAVNAYFKTTNFDIELEERLGDDGLFKSMTMPVLFLQGGQDPGQHPEEYENVADFVADGSVIIVEDASHFPHLEKPEKITGIIRDFITK